MEKKVNLEREQENSLCHREVWREKRGGMGVIRKLKCCGKVAHKDWKRGQHRSPAARVGAGRGENQQHPISQAWEDKVLRGETRKKNAQSNRLPRGNQYHDRPKEKWGETFPKSREHTSTKDSSNLRGRQKITVSPTNWGDGVQDRLKS